MRNNDNSIYFISNGWRFYHCYSQNKVSQQNYVDAQNQNSFQHSCVAVAAIRRENKKHEQLIKVFSPFQFRSAKLD